MVINAEPVIGFFQVNHFLEGVMKMDIASINSLALSMERKG